MEMYCREHDYYLFKFFFGNFKNLDPPSHSIIISSIQACDEEQQ